MEDLVFKFFSISNDILSDVLILEFKKKIEDIRNDYSTLPGESKVYTDAQLDEVRAINKICRQIAKLKY
jgi:hypothetical protein